MSRLLVVAAVASVVLAYSNTVPVVAWSSLHSSVLESLPSRLDNTFHSFSLLERIVLAEGICNHDAIIIIEQPGLHASDLRTLPPTTHIARSLSSSPSALQYPYIPAYPELDLTSIAGRVSSKCGSRLLQYSPVQADFRLEQNAKHVVCLEMPRLEESGQARKEAMANHERLLGVELESLAAEFPNHIVIYAGSPLSASSLFSKRQAADAPGRPILDLSSQTLTSSASSAANTTLPSGGILKRYQLLTPGLITILLVVFFILVPVLLIGMNALASIQNPVRSDISKSFNAQERKNQ